MFRAALPFRDNLYEPHRDDAHLYLRMAFLSDRNSALCAIVMRKRCFLNALQRTESLYDG